MDKAAPYVAELPAPVTMSPRVNNVEWYVKWGIKVGSVIIGLLVLLFGIFTVISFSWQCIVAGIVLIASSILIIALEVPLLCSFVEIIKPLYKFSEGITPVLKMFVYAALGIIVIILCHGIYAILGAVLVLVEAGFYFYITFRR